MHVRTIFKFIAPIVVIGIIYSGFIFGFLSFYPGEYIEGTQYAGPLSSQRAMLISKDDIEELRSKLPD